MDKLQTIQREKASMGILSNNINPNISKEGFFENY